LELLSRKQHRTLTSVVEWALNKALTDSNEGLWRYAGGGKAFHLEEVWDVNESDRFINLAYFDQSLLTFEEEILWKVICENAYYWFGVEQNTVIQWDIREKDRLLVDRVREDWETLNLISRGEKEPVSLPWYIQSQRHGDCIRYIHPQDNYRHALLYEKTTEYTSTDLLTEDDIPF
jgi:hypothetical protein